MTSFIPESEYAADTMTVVLRIERRRMSANVRTILESTERGATIVHFPVFVFAEIMYLAERRRIDASLDDVEELMQRYPNYRAYPMTLGTVRASAEIRDIHELHDRLIAGAARALGVPLITNDPVIRASSFVRTFW